MVSTKNRWTPCREQEGSGRCVGQTLTVQVAGEPVMLRYNSKLPLVIFAPQDVEIRYRLWSAGPTWPAASQ